MARPLRPQTNRRISDIFRRLDYAALGPVYCDEGGEEFWKAKRGPCRTRGSVVAAALRSKLTPGGRSLYVGAGVPEVPPLVMEVVELGRTVEAYNLRGIEVRVLNQACTAADVHFHRGDAGSAPGRYDHVWMVSVLNDPERFPDLSAVSYGRASPLLLRPSRFDRERRIVRALVRRCLAKLARPGWVTTTTEEVQWLAEWCHQRRIPYAVGSRHYPSATVGDPICFVRVGKRPERRRPV